MEDIRIALLGKLHEAFTGLQSTVQCSTRLAPMADRSSDFVMRDQGVPKAFDGFEIDATTELANRLLPNGDRNTEEREGPFTSISQHHPVSINPFDHSPLTTQPPLFLFLT